METNNKNNKVNIKLERHKWPDEIRKERRKRRIITSVVLSWVILFVSGFLVGNFLNEASTFNNTSNLTSFDNVYSTLKNNWYFGNEFDNIEKQLMENAINGMIDLNGDIHTAYMSAEEIEELNKSINMSFDGIGVSYQLIGETPIITRVYKDSPAEKAGVLPGDIMLSVDGIGIEDKTSEEIKEMVTGKRGSDVVIVFKRGNDTVTYTITRNAVNALAWGEILPGNIGYIEISSFGNQLADIVESYLQDFKSKGVNDIIIDLRDNGGGYLSAIEDIGNLFFDNGQILYQEEFKDGEVVKYEIKKSKKQDYEFEDIIVLINENSASAAEVLAVNFQENTDAIIMGNYSYGKGTVQTTKQYSDGTGLKYTIAKWLSPLGNSIHGIGITPDELVLQDDIFYTEYVELSDGDVYAYDSVGDAVSYVQKGLSYLGLHSGRTDGYFDQTTLQSLQAFNSKYGYTGNDITQDTITNVYQEVLSDWSINKKANDIQLNTAIDTLKE